MRAVNQNNGTAGQFGPRSLQEWQQTQRWHNQVGHEENLIQRLTDSLKRATSLKRRTRYGQRILKAQARLLALKLTAP